MIICGTIYHAIKYGTLITWNNRVIISWLCIGIICLILSITFNSAKIFCPFNNGDSELKTLNWNGESPEFVALLAYCTCYMTPMCISLLLISLYSLLAGIYGKRISTNAINTVTQQIQLYPIITALAILPIGCFFVLTATFGKEVRHLFQVGGLLCSSSGTVVGMVYLRNNSASFKKNHQQVYKSTTDLVAASSSLDVSLMSDGLNESDVSNPSFVTF